LLLNGNRLNHSTAKIVLSSQARRMPAHLALVAPVHPKVMPVILHDKDYDRWLSAPWENLKELVAPYPSQLMDASSQAEQEGNMLRPYIGVRGSGPFAISEYCPR
jgi:hypothetical protein